VSALDGARGGVEEEEGAGTVRGLGLPHLEARLPEQRRLLVPQQPRQTRAYKSTQSHAGLAPTVRTARG
jgi:hypothetical protein